MKKTTLLLLMGILWSWCSMAQVPIGVQDGTSSNIPINGLYDYSYSQQIVYQNEINANGNITSISFYLVTGANSVPNDNWSVYVGHTAKTQFTTTTDWIPVGSMSSVFDGTVTFPAIGNWMTVTFTTPFAYNGTDNLVVAILEKKPAYASMSFGRTADVPNSNRSIYTSRDGSIIDANAPPTGKARYNHINNMILGGIQQSCPAPSNLVVSNETLTSADVVWVENGSATQWEVIYGPEGFDPQVTGVTVSANGAATATLTGLTHSTEYDVYVRSVCDALDKSSLFGPAYFSTECSIASVPYNLTFEQGANCVSIQNAGTGNNWGLYQGATSGFTGVFAGYQWHGTNAGNAWLYTAGIALTAGVDYQVSYKYGASGYTEKMKVAIGTSNSVAAMTTELADHPSITGSVPSVNTVTFTVPASGTYYIGFNAYSAANQNRLMLDDVSVFEAPSCFDPSNLMASNITDVSANLSWNAGLSEVSWSVIYGLQGFDPLSEGTTVVVNGTPEVAISGLAESTAYDFYVRAICGTNDESELEGPITFLTNCAAAAIPFADGFEAGNTHEQILANCWSQASVEGAQTWTVNSTFTDRARTPRSGNYNVFLRYGNEDWMFYPLALTADTSYELKFYARQDGTNGANASMMAAYGTDNSPAGMTNPIIASAPIVGGDYQEFSGYFTPTASGTYYIGIKGKINGSPWYIALDDVSVDVAASCIPPSDLAVSGMSADSANVSWTPTGSENEWEVLWGASGFDPVSEGTTVAVNGNPETTLNGLDNSSTFDVYVRAMCGVDGESGWVGPVSFSTLCTSLDAPWSENFDTGTVNTTVVPNLACWTEEFASATQNWKFSAANGDSSITPHSGALMAEFRNSSGGSATKLVSPSMDLTSINNAQLTFYFANVNWFGDIDELRVYYKQSASDTNWTLITGAEYTTEHAAWEEVVLTLPEADGATDYLVAFEGTSRFARGLNLDDVSITGDAAATCDEVTDVVVSNITENGATVSWTAAATASEGYEVNVFLEGADPLSATPVVTETVGAGVETVGINGLDAETAYDVYVTSDCGNGDTAMSAAVTFTTIPAGGCGIATVPYLMDFETAIVPGLPDCTSRENLGNGNDWITGTRSSNGMSGKVLRYSFNTSNPANAWFYTQGIQMETGVNYQISYVYYASSNWPEKMKVAYGTSPQSTAMTNELADYPSIGGPGDEMITFSPMADGVYYFGFNVYSDANQDNLFVDNIEIIVAPTCPAPTDLVVSNIAEYSVDVSWIESATATEWEVNYGGVGFDPTAGGTTVLASNNSQITLTNLTHSTSYEVYVRAVCGLGDESLWVGPVSFRTSCLADSVPFAEGFESGYTNQTELAGCWTQSSIVGVQTWVVNSLETTYNRTPRTGNYNINLRYGNEDWIFYALEFTGGTAYELKFFARQNAATGTTVQAAFGTTNDPAAMTNSIISSSNVVAGDYQEFSGYFTPSSSGTYYIGIKGTLTNSPWYLSIDDITVDLAPNCVPPSDLLVSGISADSASVSWTSVGTETEWEVLWGPSGFDPATAGTSVPVNDDPETTLNGLDDSSDFDVYVRSICGVNDQSAWVGPVSFSTLCTSIVAPISEDFESGTVGGNVVPNLSCWTQEFVNETNNWKFVAANQDSSVLPNSGALMAEFRVSSFSDPATKLITPAMDLTSLTDAKLTFYFANAAWGTDVDELRVYYKKSALDANWTLIDGGEYTTAHSTWEMVEVMLPEADGATDYLVAFEGTSKYARGVNLDDVSITGGGAVACDPVTDVTVSDITDTTATVSWTASATATDGYEVNVFIEGADPATDSPEATETVGAGVTSVAISSLNDDTTYDVYVISDCGAGNMAMSTVVTFTTDLTIGIDGNNMSQINYFPNPVKDNLTITAAKSIDNVTVYNLLGQTVIQVQPRSMNVVLDLSSLPTGTYVLKANAAESISTFKVLKQ